MAEKPGKYYEHFYIPKKASSRTQSELIEVIDIGVKIGEQTKHFTFEEFAHKLGFVLDNEIVIWMAWDRRIGRYVAVLPYEPISGSPSLLVCHLAEAGETIVLHENIVKERFASAEKGSLQLIAFTAELKKFYEQQGLSVHFVEQYPQDARLVRKEKGHE